MSDPARDAMRRREFMRYGAGAAAAAGALAGEAPAAQTPGAKAPAAKTYDLPKRTLGKTGEQVTIVNAGTWRSPDSLNRLLRHAFSRGVRYFDTAAGYHTEDRFKAWFADMPEVRKQIFVATKDHVRSPGQMVKQVDRRLEALGTDYIDLLFFHGLESNQVDWPKSKEMKDAVEAVRKTGKVRFVGFTTHDRLKAEQIQNAAEGGFVDVIMVAYQPFAEADSLNRALDAAYNKNIGLVSMKQMAGHNRIKAKLPLLLKRGLNTHQALLTAIWSDERFACTCVAMHNTDQINQNTDAARRFKPLKEAELRQLRDAVLAAGPMMCATCDGSCSRAGGTNARLGDLTRFLTYHEHHGHRQEAREGYAALTEEERDWHGADLEAARAACHLKLDFAELLPQVDRLLG